MIDDPDEYCPERSERVGIILGERLPHLLVCFSRGRRIPKRWRCVWRCLYCGERAR